MISSTPISSLATEIANELNENNSGALGQIQRLIDITGEDFVQDLLEKTRDVENKGGMFISNEREARRRTPGGVFFHIAKEHITDEQKKIVFPSLPHKKKVVPIEIGPEAQLFAHQATSKLKEEDAEKKELIAQIAQLCGTDLAKSVLEIVSDMEAQEGVRRPDGTRRSPGEAFMYIASRRMTNEQRQRIWPNMPDELRPPKKKTPPPPPRSAAKPRRSPAPSGAATTAKITLIGIPDEVFRGPGYVSFTLTSFRVPNLPRELPAPAENTSYRVYVPERSWDRLVGSSGELTEGLIIEGFPAFDPEDGISVYAVAIKTRMNRPERSSSYSPYSRDRDSYQR
ncbi:MAG: hypothetical protein HUU38_24950 [Anaerolineales bacterium]|nr:hypothetical protein [Anaerolineales bacterium]